MENNSIPEILTKSYNPTEHETRLYKMWEEAGYFNPDTVKNTGLVNESKDPFSIVLPPPNVTGILHMGHAMMITVEDIIVRYKRMQGHDTLWIPGTDHAAIATQSKVEKDIQKKEGKSRYDLGREELLRRVEQFAQESHDTIITQMKAMGASCDWSREAFTLDEKRTVAVRTVFKNMYEDGLIYRKNRIVNWDPKGQTTISDDEIVYEERESVLYTFKYSEDFPIAISTTRPETKIGDVAVAVHPEDERYQKYIGKEYNLNFCDLPISIKIIADDTVLKDFGTGALGVTPAHSIIDWEIADRHNLSNRPQVINEYAKIIAPEGHFLQNKKTTEARELVVSWLKEKGLLIGEERVKQNIGTAERTSGIIEPLPKLQWFIDVNKPIEKRGGKSLKELMREPIENDNIEMIPDYFTKTYFHWIDNLKDWCISRQIWYGHRIPVWYKKDSISELYVGVNPPENLELWEQDPDTLDTWFSSGLWTFSTLGWPEQTSDLKRYHPTNILETGYEILFFWVARMILMTQYAIGEIPFKTIYLHGTVRDGQGRKMSKSLGNGIDPIDIKDRYGADAGRMALIIGTAPGTDSKVSEDKIKGYKNFANKIWNITRFVLSSIEPVSIPNESNLNDDDKKVLGEWREQLSSITTHIEKYRLYMAGEELYHYIWHTFADKIIEESKDILKDENKRKSRSILLATILTETITTLHPFMPFVTEAIWENIDGQILLDNKKPLIITQWPTHTLPQ